MIIILCKNFKIKKIKKQKRQQKQQIKLKSKKQVKKIKSSNEENDLTDLSNITDELNEKDEQFNNDIENGKILDENNPEEIQKQDQISDNNNNNNKDDDEIKIEKQNISENDETNLRIKMEKDFNFNKTKQITNMLILTEKKSNKVDNDEQHINKIRSYLNLKSKKSNISDIIMKNIKSLPIKQRISIINMKSKSSTMPSPRSSSFLSTKVKKKIIKEQDHKTKTIIYTSKIFRLPIASDINILDSKFEHQKRKSFFEIFLPPQSSKDNITKEFKTNKKRKLSSKQYHYYNSQINNKNTKEPLSQTFSSILSRSTISNNFLSSITKFKKPKNLSKTKSNIRRKSSSSHRLRFGFSGFEIGVVSSKPKKTKQSKKSEK